jgi:hypothetical protein
VFYKVVLYECYDGKMRLGYASRALDKIPWASLKNAPDVPEKPKKEKLAEIEDEN